MARNKNRKGIPLTFTLAMMVIAWVIASFILDLPPATWVQQPADQVPGAMDEESAKTPFPDKPPFRFGSRALAGVCSEYGLDAASIAQELAGFAIEAQPEWSIKRIAEENDMEQVALFEVIRELSLKR